MNNFTFLEPRNLYDKAILGYVQGEDEDKRVAYSIEKIAEIAGPLLGSPPKEEVYEYVEYNILGSTIDGENSPIYVNDSDVDFTIMGVKTEDNNGRT